MKFPSMLKILRNTQGGMGSTAKSTSTPYTDEPPVARITSDQNIVSVGTTVRFDGSTSTGINLSYSWDFGDKKATSLDDEGVTASCIYNTLGKKTVTLTVTDAKKRKATASVTITVIEVVPPPTIVEPSFEVDAGNPQTVSVGDTVLFKGSVLSAPDSVELLYSWTFDDGATSKTRNGLKASCIYTTRGEKTVTLTVSYMTDGGEVAAKDTVTINVHNPPIANAGRDQRAAVGSEVSFDGSGSIDPDGGDLTYSWDFGADADPATSNSDKPFCIYSTRGTKTVTLTVTDDEGVSRSATVTITVHDPPIADAGHDQTVAVDTEVSFDGSGSRDPDGGNLTYLWDFGADADPATSDAEMPFCIYSTPGTKTVTLTVTDDEEVEASDTVIITVIDPVMPWCTSELPAEPPAVIQLAPIPPSPPTYAVPFLTGNVPVPMSPIPLQGQRDLSELEKAAIDLVFKGSPSFSPTMLRSTVRVKVEEEANRADGSKPRGVQANGIITIYRKKFVWGDAIDAGSTVGNTDIFKPGNLDYLNTFIHEAAHWWQEHQNRYQISLQNPEETADRYDFDYYQLRNLTFDDKEAHASAVATWFIIAWQLEHRPADQLINLTSDVGLTNRWNVGTLHRYDEIDKIPHQGTSATHVTSPPVGVWITRADAEQLACHFKPLIEEIRTAQPLPASD